MAKKISFIKSISAKLTLVMLMVALIPILILISLGIKNVRNVIEDNQFDHLQTIGTLKSNQITTFLERKFRDLGVLAKEKNTIEVFDKLKAFHDNGGGTSNGGFNVTSAEYNKLYDEIDPNLRNFMESYNFADLFFICASHGHVMYSALKENDLGTNLRTGEYNNSNLAKL
ncbi:MAG: hypothetical protein HQ522_01070 [Bacteroidetes bacterium]|nr:hypothetical protein [Bacteroidota bacterium]